MLNVIYKQQDVRISLAEQETYWQKQLAGDLPILEIPLDHPRPVVQSLRRTSESIELDEKFYLELKKFCSRENTTLFITLLAAFKIILLRYTGQADVVVGSLSSGSNRDREGEKQAWFANPVALRTSLIGDPSAKELLRRVAKTVENAAAHPDYSFERLIEYVNGDHDSSRSPIFQVMLVLCNAPFCISEMPGLEGDFVGLEEYTTSCDLVVLAFEEEGVLRIKCEYDAELFESATIRRLLGHFRLLLGGLVANSEQRLSKLPLLTEAERYQLLVEWNDTQVSYPQDACLHQLFQAQVDRSPDSVALVFGNEQLTYRELNHRANQLAHYLQKLGVGPEVLIGVFMERSLEMVISLYGILKAGGAYVPLDPEYPPERVAFMVKDTQIPVLLTQQRLVARLPEHEARVICLDSDWATIATENTNNPISGVTAENLAYVIYTSGSTGRPKGVMNHHRGICNRLLWMQDAYQLLPRQADR
jgi:non-ribosomal peptide synthetase component F